MAAIVTASLLAVIPEPANAAGDGSALLAVMNEVRVAHGLRPLRADRRLERAARLHSATMLKTDTFYHGAFAARIRRVGVRAPLVGENLAWGVGRLSRARSIVRMWMASPGHRRNLLDPGYRLVGVGALRGDFGGYRSALMVTTDFAGR